MKLTRKDKLLRTRETIQKQLDGLQELRKSLYPLSAEVEHNQPPEVQWMQLRLDYLISQVKDMIFKIDEDIEHISIEERLVKIECNKKLLEDAFSLSVKKSLEVS